MIRGNPDLSTATATITASPNPHREGYTVIVMGTPRGGTSAVAGTVQRLGVFMGENLPNNYEDPDFKLSNRDNIGVAIAERNSSHDTWGFKFPNAIAYLGDFVDAFRNPVLVVVERDAVASMKRILRQRDGAPIDVMVNTLRKKLENAKLARRTGWPTLYVSYEKLVQHPESFVRELAEFLHIKAGRKTVQELLPFLEPGSYK